MGEDNIKTENTNFWYFMWCMLNNVKVHLGYWTAYACQRVRTHSDRHLYTCNLLGAYLQRNVSMKIADSVTNLPVCSDPGYFDLTFFFNKGLTIMKDGVLRFYEVGKGEGVKIKTEKAEEGCEEKEASEEWQTMVGETMLKLEANAVQQLEILLKLHQEAVTQREMMAAQADRMTQAVETMMKMVTVVDQKILRVQQQRMPPKLPTELKQVTPEKPASGAQGMPPEKKRKDSETTTSVPVKKDTPSQGNRRPRKMMNPNQARRK